MTREPQKIDISVKYGEEELRLVFSEESDIYDYCEKFKLILKFVKFDDDLINEVFSYDEEEETTSNEF